MLIGATDFGSFFSYVGALWTAIVTLILTFLLVAAFWANHHQMCRVLARTNPPVLVLNSLFVLTVGFLFFPASILADLLSNAQVASSGIATAAAVFYGLTMLAVGLTFTGTWVYGVRNPTLVVPGIDGRSVDARTRSYGIACGVFVLAILVAFVTVWATIVFEFILVGWLFAASRHELIRPNHV